MGTFFTEISEIISQMSAPKWTGGTFIAVLAFIAFRFYEFNRKSNTEVLQININRQQKQEEQEVIEFEKIVAQKDVIIQQGETRVAAAYEENRKLRETQSVERDKWAQDKANMLGQIAELEARLKVAQGI